MKQRQTPLHVSLNISAARQFFENSLAAQILRETLEGGLFLLHFAIYL